MKDVLLFPGLEHLFIDLRQVKRCMFSKFLAHISTYNACLYKLECKITKLSWKSRKYKPESKVNKKLFGLHQPLLCPIKPVNCFKKNFRGLLPLRSHLAELEAAVGRSCKPAVGEAQIEQHGCCGQQKRHHQLVGPLCSQYESENKARHD